MGSNVFLKKYKKYPKASLQEKEGWILKWDDLGKLSDETQIISLFFLARYYILNRKWSIRHNCPIQLALKNIK